MTPPVAGQERLRRWMRALPSADTTSATARARRQAEAIVDRAIAAMGGLERLAAVRDMTIHEQVWDSRAGRWARGATRYYLRGRCYREDLHRGLRQGFDGRRGYRWRYGILHAAPELQR